MNVNFPDAVVVLAYFCENDGPRVVMTTQAVPRLTESPSLSNRRTNIPWDKIAEIQADAPYNINVLSIMECHKPLNDLIEDKNDELVFGEWDRSVEIVDEENRCPACTSLGDNSAHVANDYRMKRSFVSTQTSLNDECYMAVKKATFRAMVSEKLNPLPDTPKDISFFKPSLNNSRSQRLSKLFSLTSSDPNDEGVLLFGSDDDHYTAVVRTFILKDAKSRGFQRRYLLMALSENRDMIIWNYKMILNEFSTTARLLQVAATSVYLEEQKLDKNAVIRTAKWLPQEFFKSKIEIDTTRSLEIILNDPKCYSLLSRDFVGILQRMLNHDILHHSIPQNFMSIQQSSEFSKTFALEAARDLKEQDYLMPFRKFRYWGWEEELGRRVFELLCKTEGDTVIQTRAAPTLPPSPSIEIFEKASNSLVPLTIIQQKFKPSVFKTLLWHICIGRQLICRSDALVARKQFLFAFTVLLPDDCCKFEPCSKKYKIVGEANLLGLSLATELPQKEREEIFIVRLERNPEATKDAKPMEMFYYNFIIEHLPDPFENKIPPTIVYRYINVLESYETMKLRSFLHSIVNEKLELMNRTTTIEKTCETTKKKEAYFRFFHFPSTDMDVHKFWKQIACQPPPIIFDLSPIKEELEEDIRFIINSYKKSNGHLSSTSTSSTSHDSKLLNGSLSRGSSLIR